MKILWLCNLIPPQASKAIGNTHNSFAGGWMIQVLDEVSKDNNMIICFPYEKEINKHSDGNAYYSFIEKDILKYNAVSEERFYKILKKEKPELIHIWGSEYPHTLEMIKACKRARCLDKTAISIQGLIAYYGNRTEHYFAGLPESVVHKSSVRDILRKDNIWQQREKFEIRGGFEIEAFKLIKHVFGRTEWDHLCAQRINSSINYYHWDETLREEFYKGETWNYDSCEKHSIFVSQWDYPLKGFHRLLEAISHLIDSYPDLKIYTTGKNILKKEDFLHDQRNTYYNLYIRKLINEYGLVNHVFFCGSLSASQMKKRLLKANAFVLPSSVENSSNSLGEAMLTGTPCVASDVGGTRSLITHGKDGLLYPFNENYMLENYISIIFEKPSYAEKLSENAIKTASERHDPETNYKRLLELYSIITKGETNNGQ